MVYLVFQMVSLDVAIIAYKKNNKAYNKTIKAYIAKPEKLIYQNH